MIYMQSFVQLISCSSEGCWSWWAMCLSSWLSFSSWREKRSKKKTKSVIVKHQISRSRRRRRRKWKHHQRFSFCFDHTVFCRWGHVTEIVGGIGGCCCRRVFNWLWTCDSNRSHRRLFCSFTAETIKLGKFSIWDWAEKTNPITSNHERNFFLLVKSWLGYLNHEISIQEHFDWITSERQYRKRMIATRKVKIIWKIHRWDVKFGLTRAMSETALTLSVNFLWSNLTFLKLENQSNENHLVFVSFLLDLPMNSLKKFSLMCSYSGCVDKFNKFSIFIN